MSSNENIRQTCGISLQVVPQQTRGQICSIYTAHMRLCPNSQKAYFVLPYLIQEPKTTIHHSCSTQWTGMMKIIKLYF